MGSSAADMVITETDIFLLVVFFAPPQVAASVVRSISKSRSALLDDGRGEIPRFIGNDEQALGMSPRIGSGCGDEVMLREAVISLEWTGSFSHGWGLGSTYNQ